MHGDTLCVDDIEYQKFRTMVRSPLWQNEMLKKSLEENITQKRGIIQSNVGLGSYFDKFIDMYKKEYLKLISYLYK